MNALRRLTFRTGAALAAGVLLPLRALAAGWNRNAFQSRTLSDALKNIGAANAADSKDLVIEAPEIAENGGVVPIEITSNMPGTRSIAVVLEKNPFPLAAKFDFLDGAVPFVKVNVKMSESSNVRVVAEAGGRHYAAVQAIKVTIGGCGD